MEYGYGIFPLENSNSRFEKEALEIGGKLKELKTYIEHNHLNLTIQLKKTVEEYEKERAKIESQESCDEDDYPLYLLDKHYVSLEEFHAPERSQIEYMIDTNIKFGIIGLYSLLEHSAKKICDDSQDFWSKKVSISHFNSRDYFTPVLDYMDLVIEIQVACINKSFEKIKPYRQIRNQIIHNDSGINKELELFFKTSHAIIKDDKFHFTDTSCFASFYQEAVAFFNELFFRLEEKQEFKNIKQKFNIIAERILIDKVDFDQRFEVKFDKAEVGEKSTLVCEIRPKGKKDEDFIIKFMVKRGRKNQVINTPEPPALITKGQNEKLYNFFSRFIDIANQGIEIKIFE